MGGIFKKKGNAFTLNKIQRNVWLVRVVLKSTGAPPLDRSGITRKPWQMDFEFAPMCLIFRGKDEIGRVTCMIVMEKGQGTRDSGELTTPKFPGKFWVECRGGDVCTPPLSGAPFANGIFQVIAMDSHLSESG